MKAKNTHKEKTYGQIRNERNGRRYNQRGWNGSDESAGTKVLKPAIARPLKPAAIDDGQSVDDRTAPIADTVIIPGSSTKTFALVLYILNKNENQTGTDALKIFTGQVVVGSGDGVGVSGKIGLADEVTDLESQVQSGQGGAEQQDPEDGQEG